MTDTPRQFRRLSFFDILKASTFGNLIIYWNQAIFLTFFWDSFEYNDRSEFSDIASDCYSDWNIHFDFFIILFSFSAFPLGKNQLHTLNFIT